MTEKTDSGASAPSRALALLCSPYAAVILAMFCWGCTSIIVRHLRGEVPPFGLAFWRNFAAFLMIAPFAWKSLLAQRAILRANLGILILLAAILWIGGNALLFLALQYTVAVNAALINSVEPIIIILAATILFGDRFTGVQAIGAAVSMLGVLVLIAEGSFTRLMRFDFNIGDVIVFCAYVFWAFYAVLLRKAPRNLDHRVLVAVLIGLGALCLLPFYIVETLVSRPMPFTAVSVGATLFLALFSCVIAMLLWNIGIRRLGPIRAGQFLHLIPVFTVLLAVLLLGETLALYHLAGVVLIGAGLYLTARS